MSFAVKGGWVSALPLATSILPGITRHTVVSLARGLGYRVDEEPLIRTDLYLADEVFLIGTAVEVLPVRSVDGHVIGYGNRPRTQRLRGRFADAMRGCVPELQNWAEPISPPRKVSP